MVDSLDAAPLEDEASNRNLAPGEPKGIVSGNGAVPLTPELLTIYTPLAKLLALTSLSAEIIAANQLLTTFEGRTFLHYVVKCALPSGQSVDVNYLGISYKFQGYIGIAPEWASGPLTMAGRRWLSACLLAHINATGEQVSILLRGNHPALSSEAAGGTGYSVREGAFYGDIFDLWPKKLACTGTGSVPSRKCAQGLLGGVSACGFKVPGTCQGTQKTCESVKDGIYQSCHAGVIVPGMNSATYSEAITVYVNP